MRGINLIPILFCVCVVSSLFLLALAVQAPSKSQTFNSNSALRFGFWFPYDLSNYKKSYSAKELVLFHVSIVILRFVCLCFFFLVLL